MSHSNLPETVVDRIAAAFTLVTVAALVWLIAVVPQESLSAGFSDRAAPAVDSHPDAAAGPVAADYFPARFKAPEGLPAEPIATF